MISDKECNKIKETIDRGNHKELYKLLSKYEGKDITSSLIYNDSTILMYALENGNPEVIRTLLDFGVRSYQLKAANNEAKSACRNSNFRYEALELLISARIISSDDINSDGVYEFGESLDSDGKTPLLLCIAAGDKRSLELLITNGAKLNLSIRNCEYPLDVAIKRKDKEIIMLLLKYGARASNLVSSNDIPDPEIKRIIKNYSFNAEDNIKGLLRKPDKLGKLESVICQIHKSNDLVYAYVLNFNKAVISIDGNYSENQINVLSSFPDETDVAIFRNIGASTDWNDLIGCKIFQASVIKGINDESYGLRLEFGKSWGKWDSNPIIAELTTKAYKTLDYFIFKNKGEAPSAIEDTYPDNDIQELGRSLPFNKGQLVEDLKFGKGRILGVYNKEPEQRLEINFEKHGVKILSTKTSNLKIISDQ